MWNIDPPYVFHNLKIDSRSMKGVCVALGLAACLSRFADARMEHLSMNRERRQYVVVSSFGLLQGGSISVKFMDVSGLCVDYFGW